MLHLLAQHHDCAQCWAVHHPALQAQEGSCPAAALLLDALSLNASLLHQYGLYWSVPAAKAAADSPERQQAAPPPDLLPLRLPRPMRLRSLDTCSRQPITLLHVGHVCLSQGSSRSGQALQQQQQAGLGWAGLGWAGLGWAGLGSRSSSDRRGMHLLSLGLYEAALKERLRYMGLRYIFNLTVCS